MAEDRQLLLLCLHSLLALTRGCLGGDDGMLSANRLQMPDWTTQNSRRPPRPPTESPDGPATKREARFPIFRNHHTESLLLKAPRRTRLAPGLVPGLVPGLAPVLGVVQQVGGRGEEEEERRKERFWTGETGRTGGLSGANRLRQQGALKHRDRLQPPLHHSALKLMKTSHCCYFRLFLGKNQV